MTNLTKFKVLKTIGIICFIAALVCFLPTLFYNGLLLYTELGWIFMLIGWWTEYRAKKIKL